MPDIKKLAKKYPPALNGDYRCVWCGTILSLSPSDVDVYTPRYSYESNKENVPFDSVDGPCPSCHPDYYKDRIADGDRNKDIDSAFYFEPKPKLFGAQDWFEVALIGFGFFLFGIIIVLIVGAAMSAMSGA